MPKIRTNIIKLAIMLTDCMDVKMGLVKMDESRPEYKMLDELLSDEQADLMLKMGRRKPATAAELSKKISWEETRVQTILDELADIGLVEYNFHNPDHHKQFVVPIFVVGSCENLVLNKKLMNEHPYIADFFYDMGEKPLEMISHMVPPGGAGLGFHVIPIERAIPNNSQCLSIEKLSYWLDKYQNQLAVCDCVCRKTMIARGEGCGELPDKGCICAGDYADYLIETGKAEKASYDEVISLLKRSEQNGFMHQVTNGDGGEEIFAICNCSVGNCFALRCSQLFNNQNLSASAYRAVVNRDKCVACGKCVEVCPAGAVRLGQKLCTTDGEVKYCHESTPSETIGWNRKNWHEDYRNRNRINCYESGTAPCKAACPAHVSIQGTLELIRQERYLDALKLIRLDNPFPSLCEVNCKHICEMACMRKELDTAMEISAAMKKLADMQDQFKDQLIPVKVRMKGEDIDYDIPIAIVGTGYAELSCAYYLAQMGYPVTVFGTDPVCSEAELYIIKKLGVIFTEGKIEKDKYAAVYPELFHYSSTAAPNLVEDGHEAAKSIHRYVHSGHSQTLARDPRNFKAIKRSNIIVPAEKAKTHSCLSCGASYVDPNRCIGCGICTTRCFFNAITIERSHPEFINYCSADDTVKNVVINGVKRVGTIAVKSIKKRQA